MSVDPLKMPVKPATVTSNPASSTTQPTSGLVEQSTEQGKLIAKVMLMGIDTINNELDVESIFKKATEGEDRTVEFIVHEDGKADNVLFHQGYHVIKSKIYPVTLPKYTVRYTLSESAWMSLITQRRSFRELFWYSEMDAEGEWFMRDFTIWSGFFEVYGEKVKVPFLARMALRPKSGEA